MLKFNKVYECSFYYFLIIYVLELFLACILYFYLPSIVPLHIGLSSVDYWGRGKYLVFILPLLLICVSYVSKSSYVERKYLPGTRTTFLVKLFLLMLQVLCLFGSINYFYILIMLVFKGSSFLH